MSGKPKINYVELARERGLGLGLDVTNYSPWKNKTSFQVRRCFTQDDIVVMREPGTVVHYSHEVVHRKDMIFNTNTQPGALSAAVKVGMDEGFSHEVAYSQQVIGTRVHTRTISFNVPPGDAEHTSFESDLRKAIDFANIEENEQRQQTLVGLCTEFITKYGITHYSTALMFGAMKYQVVSLKEYNRLFSAGGKAGTAVPVPAASSVSAHIELTHAVMRFSKHVQIDVIGKLADGFSVAKEEVIGIEIMPIDRLVKTPDLARALQQAVQQYCEERLKKCE